MANEASAMVMTVLEAEVGEAESATLEAEFRARSSRGLPPGLVQAFLVRGKGEPATWRIVSLWESGEALARMQKAEPTPGGILRFRAAGAEPRLALFDVIANTRR